MGTLISLDGKRFGRLTVAHQLENRNKRTYWRCICDCGNTVDVMGQSLKNGSTKSCGCYNKEVAADTRRTHGCSTSRTYRSWNKLRDRCNNPNNDKYHLYGGRGVSVCARWDSFENFLADMGERPKGTSIDRYPNPDGNYEPSNCRWSTIEKQNRNTSRNVLTEEDVPFIRMYRNYGYIAKEVAEIFDTSLSNIYAIWTGRTWVDC